MIRFSNGRTAQYFIASGALAFDGEGWWWERPMVKAGMINPKLFTVVLKSLTINQTKGNLRWWKPWTCVRPIKGGAVNKVGLTNRGFSWWLKNIAPKLDFVNQNFVVSLYGSKDELVIMSRKLNDLPVTAIELNCSCPNTGHTKDATEVIIASVKAVNLASSHPLILKISADQEGVILAYSLLSVIQAMSFNTMPWSKVYPNRVSPLHKLEAKVGGGGGGVSGSVLQRYNWPFMKKIHEACDRLPLIASSIMDYDDVFRAREYGCQAESFGTIHMTTKGRPWTLFTNPLKATRIVRRLNSLGSFIEGAEEAASRARYVRV